MGNIGKRHADIILQNPNAKLEAVCDIYSQNNDYICNTTTQKYLNYNNLLQNPNIHIVNVCTPNYLHAQHTIKALNAQKHVLCEKPMAISTRDCQEMIRAAEKNKRLLFVVKQNRFNPPVIAVKQLIQNNTLGVIYQVLINCFWNRNEDYYLKSPWRGSAVKDGGILLTQFSHFVDIMYYLFGKTQCLSGIAHNFAHQNTIEFEDSCSFILQPLNSKTIINFNASICTHQQNMEGSITIIAEKGTLKIGGEYLNTVEYQNIYNYTIPKLPQGNLPNNYGTYKGSMSNHDKVIENVINTLHGLDTIATNGYEGEQVIQIIEQMYQCVKKN